MQKVKFKIEIEREDFVGNSALTIGNVTYKTSGNITFSDNEDESYFLAESPLMAKMDTVFQEGFLGNGMLNLLKKFKS